MERRHFKAKYLALYQPKSVQNVHVFQFYEIDWRHIEIKELQSLNTRSEVLEKVGDYKYSEFIKNSKSKLPDSGCEVIIRQNEKKFFSIDLYDVVFREHSGGRNVDHVAVRDSRFNRLNDSAFISEGVIYFSLLTDIVVPLTANSQTTLLNANENISLGTDSVIIEDQILNPPRTIWNSFQRPQIVLPKVNTHDIQFLGGCLSGIGRLLSFLIGIFILVYLLGLLVSAFKFKQKEEAKLVRKDDGSVLQDPPRLNPKQDTFAPMPWDYLIRHKINWSDFVNNKFAARYSTSTKAFADSKHLHDGFANPQGVSSEDYFKGVYNEFSSHDISKIDSLTNYYAKESERKKLTREETAEMVVTCIQEIPYYLVHDGSCEMAASQGGFLLTYHREGKPCLPNIIAGVQSPYEFIHNLKGDCDTRSLLAYTILTKLGIPASIWVSQVYGHSVLGVGLGARGQYSKSVNGIRYAPVELTAKGYRLGMISPNQGDMDNWSIVLTNK